jgi:hypothetical protein
MSKHSDISACADICFSSRGRVALVTTENKNASFCRVVGVLWVWGGTLINASHPTHIVFYARPSAISLRNCNLEKNVYALIYICSSYSCLCFYLTEGFGIGLCERNFSFCSLREFFVLLLALHLNQKDVPPSVTLQTA